MICLNNIQNEIVFSGHPLIRAEHRKTFEVTKAPILSIEGDCIIGVNASKSGLDFEPSFIKMLSDDDTRVTITIKLGHEKFVIKAKGHHSLTLSHPEDLVVRKSSFTCPRTLAIQADKAAFDIPRSFVGKLRDPNTECLMTIVLTRVRDHMSLSRI